MTTHWECSQCGKPSGPFDSQCSSCGAVNPEYSPANKWAAGIFGVVLAGVGVWLIFKGGLSMPTRSGGSPIVYYGWSLVGLVVQAFSAATAMLGYAIFKNKFRMPAFACGILILVLLLIDIIFRVISR